MEGKDTIIEFEGLFKTESSEETEALGERFGQSLKGGEVIPITGALGAGKTTFIRGMARGLKVDEPDEVRSPSYTLVVQYPGPRPLLHLDAYFMKFSEDLDLCGVEDALANREVVVIEWGDRVLDHLPALSMTIEIRRLSTHTREFLFRKGPDWEIG